MASLASARPGARRPAQAGTSMRHTSKLRALALALLLLASALAGLAPASSAGLAAAPTAEQAPLTGLLMGLAATAEVEEPGARAARPAGLVLQITLENRTGRDVAGMQVRAPVPAGARVSESWLGRRGQNPGTVRGPAVSWEGLSARMGERLGPFVYRVVPEAGADGARIFREAAMEPAVTWGRPSVGRASLPLAGGLRLNGLWGEGSLRRTVLPTGLTVFTRDRPDSATVSVRLAVRAASRDEDDITAGGSHWLEHAFFLGTTTREDLDGEIDAVGGVSNASTGWEATDYWYRVPADQFDLALEVLADQMLNSTFPREAFDRERQVVFEELKLRNDTPSFRVFDEFINLVFRVSPLRRHPAGTIESVQSIPIETILSYKDRHYVAANMAIAVAGNIRHDEAVAKIERAFAALPRGSRHVRPRTPEPVQTERRVRIVEMGDANQLAEIQIGWPTPGDDHPDSPALVILEDVLGATGRRLAEEIRDRRALATSVDVSYLLFSDAGALMIEATTQPDRAQEVIDLILAEVRRIREGGLTDEEVRASLRAMAGRQALLEESNHRQTARAQIEVSGILDSWEEYMARLRPVSAADVSRVARTHLDLENYTLVIVRA